MLARPIHTLQPQRGERFDLDRLPDLREILRQCADRLPLTSLQMNAILNSAHDSDIEQLELVQTCGKELTIDDAKYRLSTDIVSKEDFLEMTPVAGRNAVFQPMPEKNMIYYNVGATTDSEPLCMMIEHKSQGTIAINMRTNPDSCWIYIDNLHVDEDCLGRLFNPIAQVEWRAKIASSWPCVRGLRVSYLASQQVLNMVLPPSLVATLLDAMVVSSGVDALFEVHREEGLPFRPWVVDGDAMLKVEPPRVGTFNAVSLKIPLHPLSVHVPNGRMEMYLSVCGCIVQNHPSCLICGRCTPWVGDAERRTTFADHCHRAGNRCLNRITLTIGKSTSNSTGNSAGGAWTDKRTCRLCIRTDLQAMALVEAIADIVQFANNAKEMSSSASKLIEHVSKLPPSTYVMNDSPLTKNVTKLLRKKTHFLNYDGKKKTTTVADRDGSTLSKTITKRYGWLFPKSNSIARA